MKAPENMYIYHKEVPQGKEIRLKKEPWTQAEHREDYLDFLDGLLTPDLEVVEFGGGGSSPYIARRVQNLEVYEGDETWHKIISDEIRKEYIANAIIFLDPDYATDFSNTEPRFDVAIVDVWHGPNRIKCIESAMECVRSGGYLIYHNRIFMERLKREGWAPIKKWGKWKIAWRKP